MAIFFYLKGKREKSKKISPTFFFFYSNCIFDKMTKTLHAQLLKSLERFDPTITVDDEGKIVVEISSSMFMIQERSRKIAKDARARGWAVSVKGKGPYGNQSQVVSWIEGFPAYAIHRTINQEMFLSKPGCECEVVIQLAHPLFFYAQRTKNASSAQLDFLKKVERYLLGAANDIDLFDTLSSLQQQYKELYFGKREPIIEFILSTYA